MSGSFTDLTLNDDRSINDEIIGVYFLPDEDPPDYEGIFFLLADNSIVRAGRELLPYSGWLPAESDFTMLKARLIGMQAKFFNFDTTLSS